MFLSLIILFTLPFLDRELIKNKNYKPFNRIMFWMFVFNFIFLGYLGGQLPVTPYIELGLICSHIHLLYFIFFIVISSINSNLYLNNKILSK